MSSTSAVGAIRLMMSTPCSAEALDSLGLAARNDLTIVPPKPEQVLSGIFSVYLEFDHSESHYLADLSCLSASLQAMHKQSGAWSRATNEEWE
jgi:hypothetical protein